MTKALPTLPMLLTCGTGKKHVKSIITIQLMFQVWLHKHSPALVLKHLRIKHLLLYNEIFINIVYFYFNVFIFSYELIAKCFVCFFKKNKKMTWPPFLFLNFLFIMIIIISLLLFKILISKRKPSYSSGSSFILAKSL